jgi:pimeloyl-ACP methyl ester carboxylesterase
MNKKILCLNGWGQEPKTLENEFKNIFKDAEFETYDYVASNNDGIFPRNYEGCKEYDITIAWSLGTHCAINLIQKKLLKTKLLILIAPIFQFVENEANKVGMPKEMFDSFFNGFTKYPKATMQLLIAMSASCDKNERWLLSMHLLTALSARCNKNANLVFNKMKIQDLNVLSCYALEKQLLHLKDFSCFDVNFKKFPKTICFSGANDTIVPSSQTKLFAERIKDFELHIIEDCGHAPHFSHIEEIEKVLKNFI